MAFTIPSNQNFPTAKQVPDHAILDQFNKQTYLGNAFVASNVGLSLSSTNETNVLLVTNPSTTKSLFINLRSYSSSAQGVLIKSYANATVSTTGTAQVPVNLRPANANTSVSACYSNGNFTVSSNGTLISAIGCSTGYFVTNDSSLLIIIDPGQNLLITSTALVSNTVLNSNISFYEL